MTKAAAHPKQTALLIRCTEEEAKLIRDAARKERRTLSGYILHAVMRRLETQAKLNEAIEKSIAKSKKARAARTNG